MPALAIVEPLEIVKHILLRVGARSPRRVARQLATALSCDLRCPRNRGRRSSDRTGRGKEGRLSLLGRREYGAGRARTSGLVRCTLGASYLPDQLPRG